MADTPLLYFLPLELVHVILLTYLPHQYCLKKDRGGTAVLARVFPLSPRLLLRCGAMLKRVLAHQRRYTRYRYEAVAWVACTMRPFTNQPLATFLSTHFDSEPATEMQRLLTTRMQCGYIHSGRVLGYYRIAQYSRITMVKVGYKLVDDGYMLFRMEWIIWYNDRPAGHLWPSATMPLRRRLNSSL